MDLKDTHILSTIKQNIVEHFTMAGFNPNYYYAREKILARLDAIGNSKFDREVAEQIFDQCSQKQTGLGDISVAEFAEMYAKGVVLSRQKIENLKTVIEEQKKKLHFYRMKTDEVREKDKKVLVVRVKSFIHLDILARSVKLAVTVNSITKTTRSYALENFIDANELLDFEVNDHVRFMTVLLYADQNEGQSWAGTAEVNILAEVKGDNLDKSYSVELRDKKDKTLNDVKLMNRYEDELNYKIAIIDQEIMDKQENLEFTQKFLETCVLPFPNLDKDKRISEGLGSKLEVKREEIGSRALNADDAKIARSPLQLWKDLFHSHPILKVASIFFGLHLALVMSASLQRNLFYDQFLSMMVIGQMFIFVHFNILWAFKLAAGLFIQNIIDGFWMYYCARQWWNSDYLDSHSLYTIRDVVVVCTIALFFIRFILMWLTIRLGYLKMIDESEDFKSNPPNLQDVILNPEFSNSEMRLSRF